MLSRDLDFPPQHCFLTTSTNSFDYRPAFSTSARAFHIIISRLHLQFTSLRNPRQPQTPSSHDGGGEEYVIRHLGLNRPPYPSQHVLGTPRGLTCHQPIASVPRSLDCDSSTALRKSSRSSYFSRRCNRLHTHGNPVILETRARIANSLHHREYQSFAHTTAPSLRIGLVGDGGCLYRMSRVQLLSGMARRLGDISLHAFGDRRTYSALYALTRSPREFPQKRRRSRSSSRSRNPDCPTSYHQHCKLEPLKRSVLRCNPIFDMLLHGEIFHKWLEKVVA